MTQKIDLKEFSLFDHSPFVTMVLDSKNEIIYYNFFCVTFFKTPPRVIKKVKKLNELFSAQEINFDEFIQKSKASNDVVNGLEMTIEFKHDKSESAVVIPTLIQHKGQCILVLKDLTIENRLHNKYRQQMEELKQNHAQIVQADKLTTLGELTAGISHEINNPLTIAMGNVEVMELLLPDKAPPTVKESLNNVKESLDRIDQIVRNMRQFLHKSEDKKEYCDLHSIIQGILSLMARSFEDASIVVEVDIQEKTAVGLVNKIKIEQALMNLLKNALDALKSTGKQNERKVKITLAKDSDDEMLRLEIHDNGPGIAQEDRENIFTPFFTTKDVGDGTGLGLSIAHKIIEAHHGELFLKDDQSEKGCTFVIRLPCIETSSYSHNERYLHGLSHTEDKKILVVDDEIQILNVINKFLEETSFVFIGSAHAQDALKVLDQFPVDLVITDYNMPGMNGREFVETMRAKGIEIPVVYLTALKQVDRFKEDQDKLGVKGLILKPFGKEELIKSIENVLGQKSEGGQ